MADISDSCILGLDFLQQQHWQLNIEEGLLSFGNFQVPPLRPLTDDLGMGCYRVIALEDINIQPHTENIIPAKVVDYTGKDFWGITEPTDEGINSWSPDWKSFNETNKRNYCSFNTND